MLHLRPHGFEVALHPVDANCDTVDQGERLRVLCKHRSKHACNDVSRLLFRVVGSRSVESEFSRTMKQQACGRSGSDQNSFWYSPSKQHYQSDPADQGCVPIEYRSPRLAQQKGVAGRRAICKRPFMVPREHQLSPCRMPYSNWRGRCAGVTDRQSACETGQSGPYR